MKSGIVTDINIHESTIDVKRKIRIIPILFQIKRLMHHASHVSSRFSCSQDGSNTYKSSINNTHNITALLIE